MRGSLSSIARLEIGEKSENRIVARMDKEMVRPYAECSTIWIKELKMTPASGVWVGLCPKEYRYSGIEGRVALKVLLKPTEVTVPACDVIIFKMEE